MSKGRTIQITFDTVEECENAKRYARIKKKCSASVYMRQLLNAEIIRHPIKSKNVDLSVLIEKTVYKVLKDNNIV